MYFEFDDYQNVKYLFGECKKGVLRESDVTFSLIAEYVCPLNEFSKKFNLVVREGAGGGD